jgi:UDP-3-O-[3-hydroxymyristoyl] N-acetylglucosamine deacetylase
MLRKNNMALGASLENTVVFDANGNSINDDGLRCVNEPVRHKILDIIGDLALCQGEIVGRYDGFCSSHKINNLILRELFNDDSNYAILE